MSSNLGSIYSLFTSEEEQNKATSNRNFETLSEENKKLKLLLSTTSQEAKMGSWFWDLNTNNISWSDEVYDIFELDKNNTPSIEQVRSIIIDEDIAEYEEKIEKIYRKKNATPVRILYRILTRSGIKKHISAKGTFMTDSDGIPISLVGTIQDITNQSETAEYFQHTKTNYTFLTQSLPLGIFRSNLEGKILFVNDSMVELFGAKDMEELMAVPILSFYKSPEQREVLIDNLRSKERLLDYKLELYRQDGTSFIAEVNCLMKDGEIHGIIQDSSEKIKTEQEKNNLISRLESQNNELEKFAYIISHNLRSPLSNIMGLLQLIEEGELSQKNKELFELLGLSTDKLDMIIKDLNQIVSIRESKNSHFELIQLNTVFQNTLNHLNIDKLPYKTKITSNISSKDQLHCIAGFIDGILENLLDNAIKFHDPNKEENQIHISFSKKVDTYHLEITDNGVGFNMQCNKERLFKLYEKFHPNTPGRGVGLYKTYNLVNVLKGQISIDSTPNKGTCISIELPRY